MGKFIHTRHHHVIWLSVSGAISILLFAAVGVGAITYERAYENRIFPGVRIGTIPVGELTKAEAVTRIQQVLDAYLGQGLPYVLDGRLVVIDPIIIGQQDPDLSYRLVEVDAAALVDAAFAIGRRASFAATWTERVRGATRDGLVVPLEATVASDQLSAALAENLGGALERMDPPRIAAVVRDGEVSWEITEGHPGRALDGASIAAATALRIASLDPAAIPITTVVQEPPYAKADVAAVLPALDAALARAPLTLVLPSDAGGAADRRWQVDRATLATWFTVLPGPTPGLDRDAIEAFLAPIAASVERTAVEPRLVMDPASKRVREFRAAREGVRMDRTALAAALHEAVFGQRPPLIPIALVREQATATLADTNDLGIRELLGVGRTSFKGSPPNRRHNISIGTKLLNGILIAPDEEFSLVSALAPFDAANGYRAELVIKGSRTIPEFGGGLCQVATTMFRVALAAGLPITERAAHAYRVPYYEPPVGMDATIYGPKPDFRFRNDTGRHLLLRTRVEGDDLVYELWGTTDGRIASTSEPEVYNSIAPPPMKIVETEDLPPGVKKCTERAHTGADAKFTYTVTHADGRKEERVFKSHYRPWQAVCLIGKKLEVESEKLEVQTAPVPIPATDTSAPPAPPSETPSIGGAN